MHVKIPHDVVKRHKRAVRGLHRLREQLNVREWCSPLQIPKPVNVYPSALPGFSASSLSWTVPRFAGRAAPSLNESLEAALSNMEGIGGCRGSWTGVGTLGCACDTAEGQRRSGASCAAPIRVTPITANFYRSTRCYTRRPSLDRCFP